MSTGNQPRMEPSSRRASKAGLPAWAWALFLVVALLVAMITMVLISAGVYLYRLSQQKQQQPIVRITTQFPGMPNDVVEKEVAQPVARWVRQITDVQEVTTITTESRCDVYVTARPGADAKSLIASVRIYVSSELSELPAETRPPIAELLRKGETIPNVEIYDKPELDVSVDAERLAQLGIDHAAFQKALAEAMRTNNTLPADLTITVGQQTVKLTDVATLVVKYQPSHIVNRYPK